MASDNTAPVNVQVILDTDRPEQRRTFEAWAEWAGVNIEALVHGGCGCCVDLYTLAVSPAAAAALAARLEAVGSGVAILPN
ncbi:hypothetical protein [Deinococcus planocerae]|uniref:hypothetical protein n=1 Tax=Deinococcus planocerae TaxID=1737569 RepID=UPI0011AF3687|nr:hypothetical protein [Deinococcus planocerae]